MLNTSDVHCYSVMFIGLKTGDNIYAQQKGIGQINTGVTEGGGPAIKSYLIQLMILVTHFPVTTRQEHPPMR